MREGVVVVVVDASFRDGMAGIAAVADGHDEIVRACVPVRSSAAAERMAIGRALERIREIGWPRGVLLADSATAVRAVVRAGSAVPDGWAVKWASRTRVGPAHRVARRELRLYLGGVP